MTAPGRVTIDRRGDVACISVEGDIDLANGDGLLEDIVTTATATDVRRVVLDLGGVEYLDSSGVRLVFEASHELAHLGVDLALVRPRAPYIARVLSLAAVEQMVPVYGSPAEALHG